MVGGDDLVARLEPERPQDGVHPGGGVRNEGDVVRVGADERRERVPGPGQEPRQASPEEVDRLALEAQPELRLEVQDGARARPEGAMIQIGDLGVERPEPGPRAPRLFRLPCAVRAHREESSVAAGTVNSSLGQAWPRAAQRRPGGDAVIDETLTMIPGPTPVHPRILDALARPTVSHVAPSFVEEFREGARRVPHASARASRASPSSSRAGGTLAMEMALVNVVAPGERLLVVSQGYFGDRFGELATAFGIPCDVLRSDWGTAVAPEEVRRGSAPAGLRGRHDQPRRHLHGNEGPGLGVCRAAAGARRALDPRRRLRDGRHRRAVRRLGRRRPPHGAAEGDRRPSRAWRSPLLREGDGAAKAALLGPRLLRRRDALAPRHAGPGDATSRRRA